MCYPEGYTAVMVTRGAHVHVQAGLKLLLARTHLSCAPAPLGCPRTFELIFTVLHNADMRLPGLPAPA